LFPRSQFDKMDIYWIFRFHDCKCDFSASCRNYIDEKICTWPYDRRIAKCANKFFDYLSKVDTKFNFMERTNPFNYRRRMCIISTNPYIYLKWWKNNPFFIDNKDEKLWDFCKENE